MMVERNLRSGMLAKRAISATAGLLIVAAATVGVGATASAQTQGASFTATTSCVGDVGHILVKLDNASYLYDVLILNSSDVTVGTLYDESGTAPGVLPVDIPPKPDVYTDGYPDSSYTVSVYAYGDGDPFLVDSVIVAVDCAVAATPSAAPTTTAAPATLPATGRASRNVILLAGLLTLAGSALVFVRRNPRQA